MLFDATLRKELSRTFGATLIVILTIVLTMMLIRTIGLAAGGQVSPQDVLLLLGYTALGHLPTMLALTLFIAIVITLGRQFRDSEMAIWNASGISLARFVRPVLGSAWLVLLLIGALVLVAWPWGNRNSFELRERYMQRSDLSRVAPGVFQTSRDGSRVFFIERNDDAPSEARNVFAVVSEPGKESVISARSGYLEPRADGRWLTLARGERSEVDAATGVRTLASFERYELLADERAVQRAQEQPPKARATLELLREPTPLNQAELVWRLGLLLGAGNLMLLGIGLSASNPRRPSNWNLLFALLAFVVYYNLINLSQAWVASGRIGLGSMLAALHCSAFMLALLLIWWRIHGVTLRSPRAATTATAA